MDFAESTYLLFVVVWRSRAESVTETETDVGIEKTEKYRKTEEKNEKKENSGFADDDICFLNCMHFRH